MRLALEDEGYTVEDVASGEDALARFHDEPFELVLIDLMLPGVDGFETCRELRRHSTVPVIMVTARSDTHDVVAGLEAGADDYVTKPFVAKELAARIRALLRRSRPADDARPCSPSATWTSNPRPAWSPERRRGSLHPDRVPAAVRAGRPSREGPQSRAPPRAGLGLRLFRGRPPGRRPRPAAPNQGRARPGQPPLYPHRPGYGLQAGGLTSGPGRVHLRAGSTRHRSDGPARRRATAAAAHGLASRAASDSGPG